MRVAEQILGPVDRRQANVEQIKALGKLRHVPASNLFGDARKDARAREDAVGGGRERRIVQKFLQAELTAEGQPVALGDDADEDTLLTGGIEDVVDRPGVFTLR